MDIKCLTTADPSLNDAELFLRGLDWGKLPTARSYRVLDRAGREGHLFKTMQVNGTGRGGSLGVFYHHRYLIVSYAMGSHWSCWLGEGTQWASLVVGSCCSYLYLGIRSVLLRLDLHSWSVYHQESLLQTSRMSLYTYFMASWSPVWLLCWAMPSWPCCWGWAGTSWWVRTSWWGWKSPVHSVSLFVLFCCGLNPLLPQPRALQGSVMATGFGCENCLGLSTTQYLEVKLL